MGVDIKIRIEVFHSPDPMIRVNPSHGLPQNALLGSPCTCFCGQKSADAVLIVDPALPRDLILVSDTLFARVMHDASPAWVSGEITPNGLRLGPTIGILCNPRWNESHGSLRQTKQMPGLKKMVESGTEMGALVYLFGIQGVDFQHRKVRGYVLSKGVWKKAVLPFPDAIYDQILSRKVERDPKYVERRNRLSKIYGKKIFNDGFFDKWQVHDWLTSDRRTRPYVPLTVKYDKSRDIVQFIKQHPVVFLKPIHGSLGLGIVRVTKQPDGAFVYEVKRKDGRVSDRAAAVEGLVESLRNRLKIRAYLIQEGISLALYKNRPFDVRIVMQRDGSGDWKRTKMFARVAKPGDFTSNLSSGGEAVSVDAVLRELYKNEAKRRQCRRLIRKVSLLSSEVIEEQSGKTFGELGVDLGLDDQGHVWVIEVNSKPWKSPTTEKGRQDLVDLAFSRPMTYALRLAKTT